MNEGQFFDNDDDDDDDDGNNNGNLWCLKECWYDNLMSLSCQHFSKH